MPYTLDDIRQWDDISGEYFPQPRPNNAVLLVGNGASIAVDTCFDYEALKDRAEFTKMQSRLFTEVGTSNFETVLNRLEIASSICDIHGLECETLRQNYQAIRQSLIIAVGASHVQRDRFHAPTDLAQYMIQHPEIYSLNYDLLIYWTLASQGCFNNNQIVDCFPGLVFDEEFDAENSSKLYYLHGALHLYIEDGRCKKRRSRLGEGLLSQIGLDRVGRPPHFVCEGSFNSKTAFIDGSPYLRIALARFKKTRLKLVCFGFSFDEAQDGHIIAAINNSVSERVAVSVFVGHAEDECIKFMNRIRGVIRHQVEIDFFDSASHPLGGGNHYHLELRNA